MEMYIDMQKYGLEKYLAMVYEENNIELNTYFILTQNNFKWGVKASQIPKYYFILLIYCF